MKTNKPLQAKSTEGMLKSVLPPSFRIVSDKTSNGYKFINLLYGVEIDQSRAILDQVYNNAFLNSMDLGEYATLYDVVISGVPSGSYIISEEGIPIKITDQFEFNYGEPTRLSYNDELTLSGVIESGTYLNILGLEYLRSGVSGSGYFLITKDITQKDSYIDSSYSVYRVGINRTGEITNYSGMNPGILTQDFDNTGRYEILNPIREDYLKKLYPLTRDVVISGITYTIDHYEPYHGYLDANGTIIANIDYDSDFYYNDNGDKVYYRSSLNNPYGSGNYSSSYLVLEHIPISGTLKVYDIDNLNISGGAIEILNTGTNLYTLQYSGFNIDGQGSFDPIYVGYDAIVPSGRGFITEGQTADFYKTISWDYLYDGTQYNTQTRQWDIVTSGNLINLIRINNPETRYLIEYKYEDFGKVKYITSLESTRYVRLHTTDPIYSIDNNLSNIEEIPYDFTKDTSIEKQAISFDGWKIRPGSTLTRIDFNLPVLNGGFRSLGRTTNNLQYEMVGYTNEIVPKISNRTVHYSYDFTTSIGTNKETDYTGTCDMDWTYSGVYKRVYSVFENRIGKKLMYQGDECYYNIPSGYYNDNMKISLQFKVPYEQDFTIMEYWYSPRYIKLESSGTRMILTSNNVKYYFNSAIEYTKELSYILKHTWNEETRDLNYDLYVSKNNELYRRIKGTRSENSTDFDYDNTWIKLFKNCDITLGKFEIYTEQNG